MIRILSRVYFFSTKLKPTKNIQLNRVRHNKVITATLTTKLRYGFSQLPKHKILEMPALSPTMSEGKVVKWNKNVGDALQQGDIICQVETDKATVGFEVTQKGFLAQKRETDKAIPVGSPLIVVVKKKQQIKGFENYKFQQYSSAKGSQDKEPTKQTSKTSKKAQKGQKTQTKKTEKGEQQEGEQNKQQGDKQSKKQNKETNKKQKKQQDKQQKTQQNKQLENQQDGQQNSKQGKKSTAKQNKKQAKKQDNKQVTKQDNQQNEQQNKKQGTKQNKKQANKQNKQQSNQQDKQQDDGQSKKQDKKKNVKQDKQQTQNTKQDKKQEKKFASPLAKKMASQKGIDIKDVQKGSGPQGRIIKQDIESHKSKKQAQSAQTNSKDQKSQTSSKQTQAKQKPQKIQIPENPFEQIPLTNMRKTIAARLTQSKTTIPHYYINCSVEMDKINALRTELNANQKQNGVKISVNDIIVKAIALALRDYPNVNSQWHQNTVRRFKHADVSVAVATEGGLITPIVYRADTLGLLDIAKRTKDIAARARAGKLDPKQYIGGTTTVSNVGMFGVNSVISVINPPQSTIVGVGKTQKKILHDPESINPDRPFRVAQVMELVVSADHRVVDGAVASQWLIKIKKYLENPSQMLL